MSDLDKFNYECEGQVSLFDVLDEKTLNGICYTKPAVGKSLVFHYKGKDYPCIVDKHCGYDFFHIEFTDRQPSDDFPEVKKNTGWHDKRRINGGQLRRRRRGINRNGNGNRNQCGYSN